MSNYEERFTPRKPGPKAGAGALSRWIIDRLREGNKTFHELCMGCTYSKSNLESTLGRLAMRRVVLPTGKVPGPHSRPVTVYSLNPEAEIADPRVTPIKPARASRVSPARILDDCFASIVASRSPPAE